MKDIGGKPPMELIPAEVMEFYAHAMGAGAATYKRDDWRDGAGMPWTWLIAAILRHTWAILRGEDVDPKSRLPHAAHIMAGAGMLLYYHLFRDRYHKDDRFKQEPIV